ncbi:MAG: general secretion pathway protein C [Polaromonas sp.]|nr:general secretion pathway protein C [Polaromonas sp.]
MATPSGHKLTRSSLTLLVWALAAASCVYWGLKISSGSGMPSALPVAAPAPPGVDPLLVSRLLGAVEQGPQSQPVAASRFSLIGVLGGTAGGGAALIAIDGKPAQPFRAGSQIEEGVFLKSASARQVTLAATPGGPATVTLSMPPLKD